MASPTLIDIRNIEWGKSFYWDLYFPNNSEWGIDSSTYTVPPEPPSKFQKWFPAYSISEPVFNVSNFPVNTPFVNFNIPKTLTSSDMVIQFYDTVFHEVREWLWDWSMYMFGITYDPSAIGPENTVSTSTSQQGVRPLSECCRPVALHKYNSDHSLSVKKEYIIFPSSNFLLQLTSGSEAITETCNFSVVSGMFTKSVFGSYMNVQS